MSQKMHDFNNIEIVSDFSHFLKVNFYKYDVFTFTLLILSKTKFKKFTRAELSKVT